MKNDVIICFWSSKRVFQLARRARQPRATGCLPDASQMLPRCPRCHQMLPSCCPDAPDASQMPSRCVQMLPYASKMSPDASMCLQDVSRLPRCIQMPPSSPLICDVSQVPRLRSDTVWIFCYLWRSKQIARIKCKMCVWTAQAWTDCMCHLPQKASKCDYKKVIVLVVLR